MWSEAVATMTDKFSIKIYHYKGFQLRMCNNISISENEQKQKLKMYHPKLYFTYRCLNCSI